MQVLVGRDGKVTCNSGVVTQLKFYDVSLLGSAVRWDSFRIPASRLPLLVRFVIAIAESESRRFRALRLSCMRYYR